MMPLSDGRAGVGQVVYGGPDVFFFAIFEHVLAAGGHSKEQALEALASPVVFLAESFDSKLHVGDWTVVGQAPVSPAMPFPAYKCTIGRPGNVQVEDFTGTRRRPATSLEATTLPNRSIVSPMVLEVALEAKMGLAPWLSAFDNLMVSGQTTSKDAFPE